MDFRQKLKFLNAKIIKLIICLILPLALLPLALSTEKESKCAYIVILCAGYWLLEPVAIAATALLPVVLFPLMGVVSSSEICNNYMNETFMMFIGGLIVAIAVEDCMLHERIALKVLLLIGTDIKWLLMGFMATTMFLSMWISNTATTAMMVPIVEAIVEEMGRDIESKNGDIQLEELAGNSFEVKRVSNKSDDGKISEKKSTKGNTETLKIALLLSVCYSANIGGTGTLTGTGPNLVLKAMLSDLHPESQEITFASWMIYNVPGMLICVIVAWIYLYLVYVRFSKLGRQAQPKEAIKEIIYQRYQKLGKISLQEGSVIIFFVLLVLLWTFRDPKFIKGWADVFPSDTKIGNSVPAIGIAFLLLFLPRDIRNFGNSPPLLEWKTVQAKLPWGVIILCGGGFALANGAQKSGLSAVIGNKLASLSVLPPAAVVAVLCFMTAMITEVTTNTTTATIFLPILSQMSVTTGMNPLYVMLPVAVTCSYAFMLPVATPPNAIAYDSGNMKTMQMAKPGFVMNIVCCGIQLLMINTLGVALFNLNEFPSWANSTALQPSFNGSIF